MRYREKFYTAASKEEVGGMGKTMMDAIPVFQLLQSLFHMNSVDHGFWEGEERQHPLLKLFLIITELAEAGEAIRAGTAEVPCDKGDNTLLLTQIEEEMADVVIRVLDFCEGFGIDLGKAILKKHDYNLSRPHRHGKTC